MADLKVSELESANVLGGSDLLYVVQDGTSKKIAASALFSTVSDPTLVGNIQLGDSAQILTTAGKIDISIPRTLLIGGVSADTTEIENGNVLPATIFLYTPGVSGSGTGLRFTDDVTSTNQISVSYANNKIKLNGFFPNEWVGSTAGKPFPFGLNFVKGSTYIFNVSDPTNIGNTLSFSTSIDGTNTSGTEYTANVIRNGTPGTSGANIIFTPANVSIDTGGINLLDIPDGYDGQLKIITMTETQGGSFSLVSNILNNININFTRAGDSVILVNSGNIWAIAGTTPGFQSTFTGTTDTVPEGLTNLYFTNTRARAAISGGTGIEYDPTSGIITANVTSLANINISTIATTDEINEGVANLYFTNARAIAAIVNSTALLNSGAVGNVANVIFVATNGDDNYPGNSLERPLANIHTALNRATAWTTVRVMSGQYTLYDQPVTIKARVALVGDNLRTTSVYPSKANVDMFYVENGSYVTGFTFRNHVAPAAVFSFNPNGSAGYITTSPYIQNSSSITTTGTGMRVNGAYVTGLRSMVVDSYTQTNEGGIGIHMLNRGYTQLVSVFTICCNIGILCENGGFCSITNSNTSFGTYGLVARGISDPLYTGVLASVGADGNPSNILVGNLSVKPSYGDQLYIANFNQTKCSRDVGLIVDSLAFDLLYNGNTESTFSGLQYWSQTESAIPGQSVETIDAINKAKQIATNVIYNVTVTPTYQLANLQVKDVTVTNNLSAFNRINSEFTLISDIISNGTVGVTDQIIPNKWPANTNVGLNNAANLLLANKNFIASEVLAYVQNVYPSLSFNAGTCFRDVGYIVDSIVFDLRHDGNKQAITSGVYYYNYNAGTSQITNQTTQTSAAYDYIGSIVDNIIQNKSTANYDSDKCKRDTGLIVDSLTFDMLYGSNSQSTFAALQYWAQTESAIPGESAQTIAALNYVSGLAFNVVRNVSITNLRQTNVTQIMGSSSLDVFNTANLLNNISLVSNIIQSGTVGVTDRIVPNRYPDSSNVFIQRAANALLNNKNFIAAETVAYVNQTYPTFAYNNTKCLRDVGYIVESIAFDLRHGGNKQSIQSGVYYYNNSNTITQINDQIVQTGLAYDYIGSLLPFIITNSPVTTRYQTGISQNTTAASFVSPTVLTPINNNITLIKNIITSGPNVAHEKAPIYYVPQTDDSIRRAATIIFANKEFIQAEVIGYVNTLFTPPYQDTYKQNLYAANTAPVYISNIVLNNINLITNIINNGPSVAPSKKPISLTANTDANVRNAAFNLLANKDFIKAEVLEYVNSNWANISNGAGSVYSVVGSSNLVSNTSIVTILETPAETFITGSRVSFHQPSYISASSHTMEYVGAGDVLTSALPYLGGVPIQENEVIEQRGGQVYFTSTDHLGDFRIGNNFTINRVDGTITGRTFTKALFSVMTPYILAIEG